MYTNPRGMQQDMRNPHMLYNMYPFAPYYTNQMDFYQPFQISLMQQQQPMFYPPQQQNSFVGPYTPYPMTNKQNYKKQQTQGQFSNIISQFKTSDGNYDINKVMNTAGQMMNAMNQITGIAKQVGGFFMK